MSEDAPSAGELVAEEMLPLPTWVTTPPSPLRVHEVGLCNFEQTYRLFCLDHPKFFTTGSRSWTIRYAISHALVHGVVLPPR